MDGAEVVGGGGDFELGGLEELLVAAVDEAGDLAVEQPAGAGEDQDRSRRCQAAISAAQPYLLTWKASGAAVCTLVGARDIKFWLPSSVRGRR